MKLTEQKRARNQRHQKKACVHYGFSGEFLNKRFSLGRRRRGHGQIQNIDVRVKTVANVLNQATSD